MRHLIGSLTLIAGGHDTAAPALLLWRAAGPRRGPVGVPCSVFGAGFWIGLAVALTIFVIALLIRRRNVTRIVADVTRDLGNLDREIKNVKHRILKVSEGTGETHNHLSTPLEPFVVRSRALAQVIGVAVLIALTGFGFLIFSTSQPSKARVDRLAEYRVNVGRTAYNTTNGAEIGRIIGVEVTAMNGPEQVVYRIEREGHVASFPVSNVVIRHTP